MKMIPIALSSLTMAEKFALSGQMLLRGLGTVFMVLIILFLVLKVFGMFFGGTTKEKVKPNAPVVAKAEAPAPQKEAAPATVSTPATTTDDSQLVAVITAAVAAYMSEEGKSGLPFRVVSFTRKNNASGWMGNSADNQ